MTRCSLSIYFILSMLLFATAIRAGDTGDMPPKLQPWKCADYTRRYYIKAEAPGEAGNAGLHGDAMFASVMLPLRLIGKADAPRTEPVLLVGEDGAVQPIAVHAIAGGSDTEIIFSTYPGMRRFCLYTSAKGPAAELSPTHLQATPMQVHLHGMSADASFTYLPNNPLTLKRFQLMEDGHATILAGVKPLNKSAPSHPEIQPNIDDAECPFFGIQYDIFDRIEGIVNPQRYAALYEGFLRCPVGGQYKFAVDTPGVVHVLIDGQPLISADMPDPHREAFALNKSIELAEGVHRIVVHYAEANAPDGSAKKTNVDFRRFGLRLHWQPPFSNGLLCIPPLAFVKYLPGVIAGCDTAPGTATPFIHVETLGHIRAAAQKGDGAAREYVLACARAKVDSGARLRIQAAGIDEIAGESGQAILCAWVPAGVPVTFSIDNVENAVRAVTWPSLKTGVKETLELEVMDLEAELLVKSAPEFLYPNETGHIHLEAVLSPKPTIIHKTRFDVADTTIQPNLGWEALPPLPRPMGECKVFFDQIGTTAPGTTEFDATPDESGRKKVRVSFPAQVKPDATRTQLLLRFMVGGVESQRESFCILHARAPNWPGKLVLDGGELAFAPADNSGKEHVVILVPHEDEASHRILKPLDVLSIGGGSNDVLFIGDPLVEGVAPSPQFAPAAGLSAALAKARPDVKWSALEVAGPHRYRPVFRMLVDLAAFAAAAPNKKLPKTAIVSLGSGDVARQTALHTFERALDTLLARLTAGGVEKIIVVGPIPEPWREKQCEPYQDRVTSVVNQHHVGGIDLFHAWTQETDWERRFTPNGEPSDVAGPVPNAESLDEIVQMILSRL